MGEVRQFPKRSLTPEELDEMRAMFNRPALSLDDLLTGPLEAISSVGGLLMNPDSEATETVLRIAAIACALTGGGAVRLQDGIAAFRWLVVTLEAQVAS